jgi:hypothetical protein
MALALAIVSFSLIPVNPLERSYLNRFKRYWSNRGDVWLFASGSIAVYVVRNVSLVELNSLQNRLVGSIR